MFPYVDLRVLSFTEEVGVRGWRKVGGHNLKLSGKAVERGVIISLEKLKALMMQKFMAIFPFNVTKIH